MERAVAVYQKGGTGNRDAMNGLPRLTVDSIETTSNLNAALDPFDCIRDVDLAGLQQIIHDNTFHPSTAYDRKRATPLMWAAGGGQMDIVRYLMEECPLFYQHRCQYFCFPLGFDLTSEANRCTQLWLSAQNLASSGGGMLVASGNGLTCHVIP
jgi:hypothetical protein